jgi:acyl carrier protein
MSTFDKVREVVANSTKVEKSRITGTASFKDDLGMDSLEQAELIMELEKLFDCEIPEESAEKIVTIDDAVKYLDSL